MTDYYVPGGDGKWDSLPIPDTLEACQERIQVLEMALNFYDDARSYRFDSFDNEFPTLDELIVDGGMRARVGRLAPNMQEYRNWLVELIGGM